MLLALPPASRGFVICACRQPLKTAAPTSSGPRSFSWHQFQLWDWLWAEKGFPKRPFVATYWSLCTLMSSRGTNFCAKERWRASVKRQGCFLINYTSLLCGASMAITCQQSSLCSRDGKSRCDPFPLKQLLNCISVKIPGARTDCAQGRDFVLKAPSQNSSDQGNLLRDTMKKKATGAEYDALEGRAASEQHLLLLQKGKLMSPQWCFSIRKKKKKKAQLQLHGEENIFFIFSLLLGLTDVLDNPKVGFVTQDD